MLSLSLELATAYAPFTLFHIFSDLMSNCKPLLAKFSEIPVGAITPLKLV